MQASHLGCPESSWCVILPLSLSNLYFQTVQCMLAYDWCWYLVHTTQVSSTFDTHWLASLEVISQVLMAFVTNKVTLWSPSYSACVVYAKTTIHLSVSESSGYLPPLQWILLLNINNSWFSCDVIILQNEILVLSDKRPYRNLTFHNVSARQGSSYSNRTR